ncbi:MAG TPA: hypothetical protein VH370_07200 [Humisphaera sp.]|nr:hypothetical protein [Humisphaera sp.]
MAELAARGADNLLERFFDLNHIPEVRRQAVRSLSVLNDLTDPKSKLSDADRRKEAKQLADNVDVILPNIIDPQKLLTLASALNENLANAEANRLEYWGANAGARARLRPAAAAISKLLGKAADLAAAQAKDLEAKLKPNDEAMAARWDKLDTLARNAKYQQAMSAYFVVLAAEPEDPARSKTAEEAATYLDQFDNADSGVQARVHNMKGKLSLARGAAKEARRFFMGVVNDKGQMKPPPDAFEQFDARYFSTVADVDAKDLPTAQQDLQGLTDWQKDKFPKLLADSKLTATAIEDSNKYAAALVPMLQYRVNVLRADLAQSPEEKKKATAAAEAVLLQLRKDRPELAPLIDDQLAGLTPSDRPVGQLSPIILNQLITKGDAESNKGEGQKQDAKTIARAVEAANEILSRLKNKDPQVTPQIAAHAAIAIPTLEDRANHPLPAANGYLEFATQFQKQDLKTATEAVDRAGYLVFQMRKLDRAPDGFSELYGKFLRIAIADPFNHKELAYLMGDHLQAQGKFAEALPYFRQVPKDSPQYLSSQYKQMLCLRELLDANVPEDEHKQYAKDLTEVAGVVKKLGAASTNQIDRAMAVQSTLVYAKLARTEQKDPKASMQTLADFDSLAKGLPREKELLSEALFERVQDQMALGQFKEATDILVDLLNKTEGTEGMSLVRQLLDQLDQQYQKADIAHDQATMRAITRSEAQLTGFLSDWAKNNKNPSIQKYYYAYVVYDARTKRLAGAMSDDPAEKKNLLEQTLKIYQSLLTPQMHDLYVKTLDPKKITSGEIDPKDPDASVQVGLAFTQFDLSDFKGAQATLTDLLANKKLGPPNLVENTPEGLKTKVNDLYWEATYKLLKSNSEVAKSAKDAAAMTNTQRALKNILIRGGIPDRWQDKFESLRQEIAPDFSVAGLATQPAKPSAIRK